MCYEYDKVTEDSFDYNKEVVEFILDQLPSEIAEREISDGCYYMTFEGLYNWCSITPLCKALYNKARKHFGLSEVDFDKLN